MYGSEPSLSVGTRHPAMGALTSVTSPVAASNRMLEGRMSPWGAPRPWSAASSPTARTASTRKSWTGIGAPISCWSEALVRTGGSILAPSCSGAVILSSANVALDDPEQRREIHRLGQDLHRPG